jgi:hypothetical protein
LRCIAAHGMSFHCFKSMALMRSKLGTQKRHTLTGFAMFAWNNHAERERKVA